MTGPHCRSLAELRSTDEPSFGGKSTGLGELLTAGIAVPPGFALGISAYAEFVQAAALEAQTADALAGGPADDVEAIAAASQTIEAAIKAAAVPAAIQAEVAAQYDELARSTGVPEPAVAVRSSAVGEDSQDATFAGLQETYLWVRGAGHVCEAVRGCWASLYSPPAITYRAQLASPPRAAMGVTVQQMVDAVISGVMFTCNPVSGDPSMVAIDASWGLGLAVVGGEVTPDEFLVSKVTGEVVRERIAGKQVQYVAAPDGRGTARVPVPEAQRDARCLDRRQLAELVALGRRVQEHFGCHQDIEWAIARSPGRSGRLFVVQSRPVTGVAAAAHPSGAPPSALSMVMSTFGVKPRSEEEG
jgi:pyruvate,water dikinase